MPLTLNLLHEEQKQLHQRKRDPLKLGLLSLGGVALLFVSYYAWRLFADSQLTAQLRDRQAQWAKQEPLAKAAEAQEASLNQTISTAKLVTQRIENRFYWAPLLDTLLKTVPPTIQLTSLTGSSETKDEKVSILLEGIAAAAEPRAGAEQFRTSLAEALGKKYPNVSTTFRNLEETVGTVNLDGKTLPTAKFTIDVQMQKPNAVPAAEPAAERPRRRR
jgi:Tfp pilus assembly protein PilN